MIKTTFRLRDSNGKVVMENDSLQAVWSYIRKEVNDPHEWYVQELDEKGDLVEFCNATFLIEKCKSVKKVPITISEIH